MTNVKNFVGIDVSKGFFDAAIVLVQNGSKTFIHQKFESTEAGLKAFHKWLQFYTKSKESDTVICMEHTGIYNWPITEFLNKTEYVLCLEMAMQIKMSLGIQRGKNDKLDAQRIAEYAYLHRENIEPWQPSGKVIEKLQHLMAARERVLKSIQVIEVPINEFEQMGNIEMARLLTKLNKCTLTGLNKALKKIEKELEKTVEEDETIKKLYDYVDSVKGIGPITATYLLIYTKGFTRLTDKKKLGSYAGVVPFDHTSGKTVRKRSKTSKMSCGVLRSALAMGAKSAMNHDPQLKAYKERKMAEGKDYGWCVNAVSNKLLTRALACVNNQRMYVDRLAA